MEVKKIHSRFLNECLLQKVVQPAGRISYHENVNIISVCRILSPSMKLCHTSIKTHNIIFHFLKIECILIATAFNYSWIW